MALKDENKINFKKLEEELERAVLADEKYQRENAAKFRAVEQKVASYEEFRDIVLASHLKPLDKGDRLSDMGLPNQQWNINAVKSHESDKKEQTVQLQNTKIPKNGQEFARDWRRHFVKKPDRYKYLLRLGGSELANIFKNEISNGLLGDFIDTLVDFPGEDCGKVVSIIDNLRNVKRFGLSVTFLSKKEVDTCKTLLDQLEETDTSQKEILQNLRNIYLA